MRKIVAIALLLAAAPFVYAQSVVPDPIQYIVAPENPGPNEAVHIEVDGVGQFLGNSSIIWQQDGKTMPTFTDKAYFDFTTRGVGQVTRVHVDINSPTNGAFSHDFVFNPSVVNLVWEADTYTPLLYEGKALYTAGSKLKVVAYPTVLLGSGLVPASKLSFQWYRNDDLVTDASGLGKNVFSFQGDQLQTGEDVRVDVYSGPARVGRGSIIIPASSPEVVLYPQDPLRGELLGSALSDSAQLGQTEVTLKAEPYFFAAESVGHTLTYAWTLDDQDTSGPQSAQGLLTLRQTGSGGGAADIGVSIQNTNSSQYAQAADTTLHLVFGTQAGSALSSFFGL